MRTNLLTRLCCCLFLWTPAGLSAATQTELLEKLSQGEAVALMRHAIAPGNGDPANFNVDDCSTQRNLSEEGLKQARLIGDLLHQSAIKSADVFSSQWCRCLDTAVALGLGRPVALPLLNSFYQDRSTKNQQTNDLYEWVKKRLEIEKTNAILPAILVTHQVNITALTDVFPASGEVIFITFDANKVVVLGRITTSL